MAITLRASKTIFPSTSNSVVSRFAFLEYLRKSYKEKKAGKISLPSSRDRELNGTGAYMVETGAEPKRRVSTVSFHSGALNDARPVEEIPKHCILLPTPWLF